MMIKSKNIKKSIISIFILIILVFSLACEHQNDENYSDEAGFASQESTPGIETPTDEKSAEPVNANTGAAESENTQSEQKGNQENMIYLKVNDKVFTASLENNSSADALLQLLSEGPITISMRDYGNMEKVGALNTSLPTNDEHITTEAGDIILYQGNALVIYYAPNTWNFTKLGKINDVTAEELMEALGDGNVSVTLSLDN